MMIVDECSRFSLAIKVARSLTARDVTCKLERLMTRHGPPEYLRSDHGPEFIAQAVRRLLAETATKTLDIEPGSPWQNGFSESFNSRFEGELLNLALFGTLN